MVQQQNNRRLYAEARGAGAQSITGWELSSDSEPEADRCSSPTQNNADRMNDMYLAKPQAVGPDILFYIRGDS